jgi:D-alanyl-D-alanine carboxypeptidase/D-alanyl-D-alanine-endopeptidase (penicillin-binding protein 4)
VVGRRAYAHAFWGIEVRSLKSGRVLYSLNADKYLRPASALKLLTTAAALDLLGPDARVRTSLEAGARVDAFGRLLGDLWLVGRGDPSFSTRFGAGRALAGFEELARGLEQAGVRRIEGRLVGHDGTFAGERRGADWTWEDLVWSYGAEVSALSFNDNAASLRLAPGERAGDPAMLDLDPASGHYAVAASVLTGAAGTRTDLVLTQPAPNLFRLGGSIALGDAPWQGTVAVADPARYATRAFAELLESRGIRVTGGIATSSDPLPAGLRPLAGRESPPLSEVVKVVNQESVNLYAELLLRLVGQRYQGAGTSEAGQAALRAFLVRHGQPADELVLSDGSGLSRSDLVSAASLVKLLLVMDRHPHAAVFRESLARPGGKGTLETRLSGLSGRLAAKTGTLKGANALAGYLTAADGERLAFAVLVNNHGLSTREAVAGIDDLVGLLARGRR